MSYSAIKLARDQYINQLLLRWVPNSNECGVDDVTFAEHVGGFKEIMKAVGNGVAKLEERFEFYCKCIPVDFDNKKSVQMLTQSFTHMEEYLMYICRDTWMREQRSAYQSPKEEGPGFLHQGVFTEILNDLIQDVNLDSTTIMDSLIQDELMTEDERQSVIKETTPRRRKEQLVYLMRGRLDKKTLMSQGKNPGLRALGYLPDTYRIPTQPWDSFIPAIGRDYPAVAEKIKATTEEIQLKCLKYQLCEICSMKEAIQAKSLADHLLRKQWITLDLYEDLRRDGDSNTTKWSSLLSKVSNPVHILEALEAKHPNFYNHLTISKFSDLECKCHENKNSTNIENYAKSDVTATADVANMDDFLSVMDENETLASTTKPIIDSPMDLDYLLNQIISLIHQFRPGLSVRNASAGNTQNGLQQTDVFYPISHQNWPSYSISTPLQTQRQFFVPTHIPPPRLPAQSPTNQQAAYYMYNGTPSNAHTEFSSAPQHGMCDSRPITSYVAVPGVNSNRMPGTHYVMATYSNAGTNGVSIASKPNICGRSTTSSDQVLAPRQFANFRNTFEQSPTVPVPVSTAMTSLDPSITEDTNTGIPISSNSSGLSLNTMTLNPAKSMIQSENTMKDQELQQEPLTASMLASELPQKQKELLGNRLFPFIKDMNPAMAGKITGMLLELDNIELLHMLESTESLTAKVDEAVAVIEAYAAKEATSMNRKATSLDASIIEDTNLGLPGSSSSSALSLNTMALNPSTAMKQSENKEKDQELQQEPLTATMLATESPQKQKEMLGNRLFPLIKDMNPAMAGKITGMLLELDNVELLHMLESAESLTAKVDEAVAVIEAHTAKEAASMNRKS